MLSTKFNEVAHFTFVIDATISFPLNKLVGQRLGYLRRVLYSVRHKLGSSRFYLIGRRKRTG